MNKIITASEAKQLGNSVLRQRINDYIDTRLIPHEKFNFYNLFDDIRHECTVNCSPTKTMILNYTKRFHNGLDIIKILESLDFKTELIGDDLTIKW